MTRQIREAVRLYFEQRDSVVLHTIIASAHQILIDLGKSKEIKSMLKNPTASKGTLNYPYNFFKHADKDPEAKINIGPLEEFAQGYIMDAIVMLQQLTGSIPIQAKVYWVWFVAKVSRIF